MQDGQKVKKGDRLITCELEKIAAEGYPTITPVIVTNTDAYGEIKTAVQGTVKQGEDLINLK